MPPKAKKTEPVKKKTSDDIDLDSPSSSSDEEDKKTKKTTKKAKDDGSDDDATASDDEKKIKKKRTKKTISEIKNTEIDKLDFISIYRYLVWKGSETKNVAVEQSARQMLDAMKGKVKIQFTHKNKKPFYKKNNFKKSFSHKGTYPPPPGYPPY